MSMNPTQSNVKFVYTTRANYNAITEIQGGTLYYLYDEKVVMLNGHQYGLTTTELGEEINLKITSEVINLKGQPNGFASLGTDGKVPSGQLPSYVDDVVEAENLTGLNGLATKESGKIYVAKDTNKTYRWSGSDFVEISSSLALGETSSTAYAGDKGKALRTDFDTHASNENNPHNVTKAQLGLDKVNNTSDANKPISNATQIALNQKASKQELSQTKADIVGQLGTKASIDALNTTNGNVSRNFGQLNLIKQILTWDLTGATNSNATSWTSTTATTQIVGTYTSRPSANNFMIGDVIKVETTTYTPTQVERSGPTCPEGKVCWLDNDGETHYWYETTYEPVTTVEYWLAQ